MQKPLLVVLVIVFSAIVLTLAFLYFYRIHKQLKIRYLKPIVPPPGTTPASLEQHQELAFVLTHGVEAYNDLRRERHRRERAETQAQIITEAPTAANTRRRADSSSLHSSSSAEASIEALPAYSSEPADGDVGYGWRAAGLGLEQAGLFSVPTLTGNPSSTTPNAHTSDPLVHPLSTGSATFHLPPVYRYHPPSTSSSMQSALVSTDNSPSVTLPRNRRRSSQQRAVRTEEQPFSAQTETATPITAPLPPSPPPSPLATSHPADTTLPSTFVVLDNEDSTDPGAGAVTEEPEHHLPSPAVAI